LRDEDKELMILMMIVDELIDGLGELAMTGSV
jgi:hypothetical protein